MNKTVLKARYGTEMRKNWIHHNMDMSLDDLVSKMQRYFDIKDVAGIKLKYRDEEDDWITLANDDDLAFALASMEMLYVDVLAMNAAESDQTGAKITVQAEEKPLQANQVEPVKKGGGCQQQQMPMPPPQFDQFTEIPLNGTGQMGFGAPPPALEQVKKQPMPAQFDQMTELSLNGGGSARGTPQHMQMSGFGLPPPPMNNQQQQQPVMTSMNSGGSIPPPPLGMPAQQQQFDGYGQQQPHPQQQMYYPGSQTPHSQAQQPPPASNYGTGPQMAPPPSMMPSSPPVMSTNVVNSGSIAPPPLGMPPQPQQQYGAYGQQPPHQQQQPQHQQQQMYYPGSQTPHSQAQQPPTSAYGPGPGQNAAAVAPPPMMPASFASASANPFSRQR